MCRFCISSGKIGWSSLQKVRSSKFKVKNPTLNLMKINSPTTKDSEIKRKWAIKKIDFTGISPKKNDLLATNYARRWSTHRPWRSGHSGLPSMDRPAEAKKSSLLKVYLLLIIQFQRRYIFCFGLDVVFPRRLLGAYLPTSNTLLPSSRSTPKLSSEFHSWDFNEKPLVASGYF